MSTAIRLEHIGIGAPRDRYEETIRFYERVFGWHRIKENPGDFMFVGDGHGGRLEILARDAAPLPMPHHLAFVVDREQYESIAATLRAEGVAREPTTSVFGDTLLFFNDPAGNMAQLVLRTEPLAP